MVPFTATGAATLTTFFFFCSLFPLLIWCASTLNITDSKGVSTY